MRSRPAISGSSLAFTLVEVLVSLAIFAIAAVVLASAYLNVIGGYASLAERQQQEEDWQFARVMILSQSDRPTVEAGGRLTLPDGRPLSWQAKIEPTEVADLFRVTLTADASAPAGQREPWHRERTMVLLRRAWSDPGDRSKLQADLQQQLEKGRAQ
ncbi:MAG: type II secretion system protein J [Opitutales bacterium]